MTWSFVKRIALLLILAALTGCFDTKMKTVNGASYPQSFDPEKAVIVFYRPYHHDSSFVTYELFDMTENDCELIGIVPVSSRVAYQVDPGKRLIMANGLAVDFMDAEVKKGTIYHVKLVFTGDGHSVFNFVATLPDQLEYSRDIIADCKWLVNTEKSLAWGEASKGKMLRVKAEEYPRWLNRPQSLKVKLTPKDGIPLDEQRIVQN